MIRPSIRRPVAVTMVYMAVALLGVAAWRNIPVELLPDVSFPQLTLTFTWPGSSPETVEALATSPIESAVQQVKGVERITSVTEEGRARITVSFGRDVDMDFTRLELTERLATVEEELPDAVSPLDLQPYVPQEFQEQANRPFLRYAFTGPFSMEALPLHLDDVFVPEILRIPGVSRVEIEGGRARVLEIELAPDRIAALGLRPGEIRSAVAALDLVREAGAVRDGSVEWPLTIRAHPASASDLRSAVLSMGSGSGPGTGGLPRARTVRLGDVARFRDTFEEPWYHYRIDGRPAIGFRIHRELGSNAVRLAETVKTRIAELERVSPPGSRLILQEDQSEEMRAQLADLRTRALVAAGVIFLVLLAFFGSLRAAAVVFTTISFSVLVSLNLVYFGGLTLNLLTLMGLTLGFGLVVDNSIVVLENVVRMRQGGASADVAAEEGAREVVLPILASTVTTVIVFLPFVYLQGELRLYYLPLAVVVGVTLVASLFVAFTFTPALAVRVLRAGSGSGPMVASPHSRRGTGPPGTGAGTAVPPPLYVRFYSGLLEHSLRFPWVIVGVALVCFVASAWIFQENVPRGRIWGGEQGAEPTHIDIRIALPRGSDLERVDELTREFERRLGRMPEVFRYTTRVQGTLSHIRVDFSPELEFTSVPLAVEEQLSAHSRAFTGAEVRVYGRGRAFYGGGGQTPNYRITLLGYDYERLGEIAEDLGSRLRGHVRIRDVDTNAGGFYTRGRAMEFVAEIDRETTARHGIAVAEVVAAIQARLRGGGRSGQLMVGGEPVDFRVRLEGFQLADADDLLETVVATTGSSRVTVGDLVALREREISTSIRREDQEYERTVAYEFRGPRVLGDVIRDATLEATLLPPGFSLEERTPGELPDGHERQMIGVLLVALGLVYMVTAALFESLRQPLCVLLSVPMALIGVFLAFVFMEATFTREAYIGVIMMGGIVVNNAILTVDHINRVRWETGAKLRAAIARGTLERVRPILMTTATTVLGLLPLVLFMPTSDATIWNALTYALIGGLLASTLFVLTVTPALYLLIEKEPGNPPDGSASAIRV